MLCKFVDRLYCANIIKISTQGDTLQNVANELDCIISTGYYIFTMARDSSGGMSAQIMLEYKPSSSSSSSSSSGGTMGHSPQPQSQLVTSGQHYQTTPIGSAPSDQPPFSFEDGTLQYDRTIPRVTLTKMESQGGTEVGLKLTNMERWNTEQIGDFVRKLGFLDKEKDKEGGDKIKHFLNINEVSLCIILSYRSLHTQCELSDHLINSLICII